MKQHPDESDEMFELRQDVVSMAVGQILPPAIYKWLVTGNPELYEKARRVRDGALSSLDPDTPTDEAES